LIPGAGNGKVEIVLTFTPFWSGKLEAGSRKLLKRRVWIVLIYPPFGARSLKLKAGSF
jgi:hypothetical protein